MVVDGLDEAEPEPTGGRGLPLGLPESLPDGVYVVATSRFGIDRALHAVRNPADWLQIEVEGADNLDDMRRFIQDVTSPECGDRRLVEMLGGGGVDVRWFRAMLAQACAGVWIYLRYVLDEIRDGIRNPRSIGDLPGDLAGFYAEQVERWRGPGEDEAAPAPVGAGPPAAARRPGSRPRPADRGRARRVRQSAVAGGVPCIRRGDHSRVPEPPRR